MQVHIWGGMGCCQKCRRALLEFYLNWLTEKRKLWRLGFQDLHRSYQIRSVQYMCREKFQGWSLVCVRKFLKNSRAVEMWRLDHQGEVRASFMSTLTSRKSVDVVVQMKRGPEWSASLCVWLGEKLPLIWPDIQSALFLKFVIFKSGQISESCIIL